MTILDGNYFEVEGKILEWLTEEFGVEARSPATLEDLKEQSQGDLNLYVLYAGDALDGGTSDGGQMQVDQQWMVVLSVRNSAAQIDTSKTREIAGPYVSRLLKCLMGREPSQFSSPLVRGDGQIPGYSPAFGYFPFLFKTRIVT